MKNNILFGALLLMTLAGCNNQDQNLTADVEIPVSVEDIRLKPIEEFINTTGTALPTGEILLKSKITASYFLEKNPSSGRLWQMGDRIKAGAIVARLDDAEFVNSIQMENNKLNLELTESELKKQESLYEKGGVTQRELKTASINYENAKSSVEKARLQLDKTKVPAPIDGVIVELPHYTQGTQVDAGATIARIMDYQTMYLDIQLPEKYIASIKTGQPVKLTNYTLPGDTLTGTVYQLSPAINADTRTFRGTVSIDNHDLTLRPGMFVQADIVTQRRDSAIVIPKDIILSRQKGKTVFVVDRGVAMERIIETGLENVKDAEVTKGLSKNDRIVVSGFETLSNKSKVKIIR